MTRGLWWSYGGGVFLLARYPCKRWAPDTGSRGSRRPTGTTLGRFRAKREQLEKFEGLFPESQGRSLALTGLYVALTGLYMSLTGLYVALTGLYVALTGLYSALDCLIFWP